MRADKSLSPFEIRLYRHYRVVHGIRIALAFILTFLLVRLFNIPEGTWPLITLVVIMGPISFWGNVVPRAFERIGGTILGSVLGLVALRLELFSLPLMLIWCAAAMFLCGWLALGKKPYQALLIGITLAVVVGAPAGDMNTALWRGGGCYFRFAAGDAVHRHLAATRIFTLAHSDGALCDGVQSGLSGRVVAKFVRASPAGEAFTETAERRRQNAWADYASQ